MNRITSALAFCVLVVSSLPAVPLTWKFTGTASAASQFNGSSIAGLGFELRIFLDTTLVAVDPMGLADVFFPGPHVGEVQIETLGIKPLNAFNNVQYFAPAGQVTGVQFNQPAFSDLHFPASVSSDYLHLTPIPPTVPIAANNTLQSGVFGPNALFLSGVVLSFTAVTASPQPVPEVPSTIALLGAATAALVVMRRRVSSASASSCQR